jgi:hypothetical protein
VCKALERGYNDIMLIGELLDGGTQAECSNTVILQENLEATIAEQTYVCDEVVQNMT